MVKRRSNLFNDGDRVSHAVKGLATVRTGPDTVDLIVLPKEEAKTRDNQIYVVWDDNRFPISKIRASEIEKLPSAAAAISSGV